MKLVKLKYKKKFRKILSLMSSNKVAIRLLRIEGSPYFLPFNKVKFLKNSNKVEVKSTNNNSKIEIKIGKFVNKLLASVGVTFTNAEIEEFVNLYKGLAFFDETFADFDLVTGKDIKTYYHHSKYAEDKGVLGNSCMKHKRHQKFLKFYSKNKKNVSLLILRKKGTDKIMGRAIVWNDIKLKAGIGALSKKYNEKVTFMDRIYSYDDSVTEQFKIYARMNGWMYKKNQNSERQGPFIYNNEELPNNTVLSSKLKNFKKVKEYPYVDTLCKYSLKTGRITNVHFSRSVELTSTDGDYY